MCGCFCCYSRFTKPCHLILIENLHCQLLITMSTYYSEKPCTVYYLVNDNLFLICDIAPKYNVRVFFIILPFPILHHHQ